MRFDWKAFCDRHNVPYVTKGPNTARDHLGIQCPFCGPSDHGQHMGLSLSLSRPAWGCWRDGRHRGLNPKRLIVALLKCSDDYAEQLLRFSSLPELDEFNKLAAQRGQTPSTAKEPEKPSVLTYPKEFKSLTEGGRGYLFLSYLNQRGFSNAEEVSERYDLKYCLVGSYADRLILPIKENNKLVGWTGRDTTGRRLPRYLNLPRDYTAAKKMNCKPALVELKETLQGITQAKQGGEVLVLVEGPLDWLKLDAYAPEGANVVGFFGKPTTDQIFLVSRLAKKHQKTISLLDKDAYGDSVSLAAQVQEISGRPSICLAPPYGAKDPGALTASQARKFLRECLRNT